MSLPIGLWLRHWIDPFVLFFYFRKKQHTKSGKSLETNIVKEVQEILSPAIAIIDTLLDEDELTVESSLKSKPILLA